MEHQDLETYEVAMLCKECSCLSENLTVCSQCGHSMEEAATTPDSSISGGEVPQTLKIRKREITPYGMYLKELKLNLEQKNISKNIDLVSAHKNWSNLSDEETAKYKTMSLEDKQYIKAQAGREKVDIIVKKKKAERLILKRKKDAERMVVEREKVKMLNEDVEQSKKIIHTMLADKRAALLDLDKDIDEYKEQLENLSKELTVSEKLVLVKRDKLSLLKKDYKELFSKRLT